MQFISLPELLKKPKEAKEMYKVYDKTTGLYVGTVKIKTDEIRKIEKDFILKKV